MEALAMAIVLLSVPMFIFGLVNVIRPIQKIGIRHRAIGGVIMLGAFFSFFAGGLLGAASQPGGLEGLPEDRPAAAEKNDRAPAKKAAPPANITQAEFDAVWTQATQIMGPCDRAVDTATTALQSGNAYTAYPAVQRAERTCGSVSLDMFDLDIPRSAKGEVREKLKEAKDRCQSAMTQKQIAMKGIARVLDGDARPSAVSAAQEDAERAQAMVLGCAVSFMGAAQAGGLNFAGMESGQPGE